MDAQSSLPGVSQAGRLHETNFNIMLADALRRKRKAWREYPQTIIAERTGIVEGGEGQKPDILLFAPDSYPISIETEWDEPSVADAKNRLGKRMANSRLRARAAIGGHCTLAARVGGAGGRTDQAGGGERAAWRPARCAILAAGSEPVAGGRLAILSHTEPHGMAAPSGRMQRHRISDRHDLARL